MSHHVFHVQSLFFSFSYKEQSVSESLNKGFARGTKLNLGGPFFALLMRLIANQIESQSLAYSVWSSCLNQDLPLLPLPESHRPLTFHRLMRRPARQLLDSMK